MKTNRNYVLVSLKFMFSTIFLFFVVTCSNKKDIERVIVNASPTSKAKAVYNQAYNENYGADEIDYIIENAKNAYVLLDPFQESVPASISKIKANGNEVGAYISIGTGENWRDDFTEMTPYIISTEWDEWPGEFYVKETTTGVIDVMKARIDKIAAWGCDWVEFDNMDWAHYDDTRTQYGLSVTKEESIIYFKELCDYVHSKNMKCMAKNFVENAENFDGVIYESYNKEKSWWDQSGAQRFLDAGKIVIINHYNESNCGQVYIDYKNIYNNNLSFICEDSTLGKYVHFNE